jgi:hypothetical protein
VRRRLLALACAVVLLLPVLPASAAGPGPYAHVWQAEGMVGGDLGGASRKVVRRDDMTMSLAKGGFSGGIRYEDALAVQSASGGITAQFASIEVTLTGTSAEGGAAAAGSFAGIATLVYRDGRSLDDLRDRSGDEVVYEVSGHWGARLQNGIAHGELLYERATVVSAPSPTVDYKGAAWFDRLSAEKGGGSQTFDVEVAGLASGTEVASPAAAQTSAQSGLGALAYVRRGIAGQPGGQAPPVPLATSTRARALKDAAPLGAVKLPANAVAIELDVPGAYLDAKNRAAGLLDSDGPTGPAGKRLASAWAMPASEVAADYSPPMAVDPRAVRATLAEQEAVPGASELASDLAGASFPAAIPPAQLLQLVAWRHVIEAVGARKSLASAVQPTAAVAEAVRATSLPHTGPLADAVRVAARVLGPPRAAAVVTAFKRDASADVRGSDGPLIGGGAAPATPVDLSRLVIPGTRPTNWRAYRRPDGTLYWLGAPANQVALVDGTLHGAGFSTPRAFLVDAKDVGRILAVYPAR